MVTDRWVKVSQLARLAPRKPFETLRRVAAAFETRWDKMSARPGTYRTVYLREALAELGRLLPHPIRVAELDQVDRRVTALTDALPPILFKYSTGRPLAQCAYLICRALQPSSVVETGVAYGMSTSYLLQALEANGHGRLASIDLPPLGDEEGRWVGALVPRELAGRWTLHRGASRALLPGILQASGTIDMFIHDSLHTYRTMLWEFELAWRYLAPGGVLLADDIGFNQAFERFVARVKPKYKCAFSGDDGTGCWGVAIKG